MACTTSKTKTRNAAIRFSYNLLIGRIGIHPRFAVDKIAEELGLSRNVVYNYIHDRENKAKASEIKSKGK